LPNGVNVMSQAIHETEVFARVREVLCEVLNVKPEQVTPAASFKGDLGAESLDLISVISEFEETFDAEISDEEAERIETVGDAVNLINATVARTAALP